MACNQGRCEGLYNLSQVTPPRLFKVAMSDTVGAMRESFESMGEMSFPLEIRDDIV